MIKLFTCDSEENSASRLGFPVGVNIRGLSNDYQNDICIRWGNSKKLFNNAQDKETGVNFVDFPNVINPRTSIRLNVNKMLALEKLGTVVKIPQIYKMEIPRGKKAVVREFEHTGGHGFEIINGPSEINWREKFGTEFIETQKEYRCWFANDKTFVGKRVATTPEQESQSPCRSKWGYSYLPVGECTKLREQTLRAANALGLDLGAADVLWDTNTREYIFLELNSSPSIDTNTLERFFKEGITALARRKFPNINLESSNDNGRYW